MSEKLPTGFPSETGANLQKDKSEKMAVLDDQKEFVKDTLDNAIKLIEAKNYTEFIKNPYLITTLYYSRGALEKISKKAVKTPNEEIVSGILKFITPEIVEQYMESLDNMIATQNNSTEEKINPPLDNLNIGKYWRKNHKDALDLFITEGSPIYNMASGLVVLAENDWKKDDTISTTSYRGGNTVIVYNSIEKEFYRYAHLEKSFVSAGDIINSQKIIGTVGHSGMNASKPGHGEHLHLEINAYKKEAKDIEPLSNIEIIERLGLKIDKIYSFGQKNAEILEFQKKLIHKGFLSSEATGFFDEATLLAVKEFQESNNLKADGIIGKDTINLLNT